LRKLPHPTRNKKLSKLLGRALMNLKSVIEKNRPRIALNQHPKDQSRVEKAILQV